MRRALPYAHVSSGLSTEAVAGSALALVEHELGPRASLRIEDADRDALVYVPRGRGSITLAGSARELTEASAALVLAGEAAELQAGDSGLELVHATLGPDSDRHAPLGPRAFVARLAAAGSESATGSRSFQVLFGPENGSTRATLFAGFIPPGRAPWHYHLYDEIVWVSAGSGRLHLGNDVTDLRPGSAFRLRPREVHVVENTGDGELVVIGVFTPAGSPSAAYLTPDVAAEYRFSG